MSSPSSCVKRAPSWRLPTACFQALESCCEAIQRQNSGSGRSWVQEQGGGAGVPDRWSPLPVSRLQPRGAHSRICPSSAPGAFPPRGKARGPAASSSILCLSLFVLAWAIWSSVKQDWGSDAWVLQQLRREVANKQILQWSDPAAGCTHTPGCPKPLCVSFVQKPHPGCPC